MKISEYVVPSSKLPEFLAATELLPHCVEFTIERGFSYVLNEAYGPPVSSNSTNTSVSYAMVYFDVLYGDGDRREVTLYLNTGFSALTVLAGPAVCLGFATGVFFSCLKVQAWRMENICGVGLIFALLVTLFVGTSSPLVKVVHWLRRSRQALLRAYEGLEGVERSSAK